MFSTLPKTNSMKGVKFELSSANTFTLGKSTFMLFGEELTLWIASNKI